MPLLKRTHLLLIIGERLVIAVSVFITELLVKLLFVEGEYVKYGTST